MAFYFAQVAPDQDWREAKLALWRSVDGFGPEGSAQKERAIAACVLK